MPRFSFYDLNFRVDPGGARKDAHYVRGTVEEIKADLAAELENELYLLCWYGAYVSLDVFQAGELTQSIDLHPFITVAVDGYPEITFAGPGRPVGHDFRSGIDADVEEGSLAQRMFLGELGDSVKVTVDWDRIAVPSLVGRVAGPGDLVNIDGDWPDEDDGAGADEDEPSDWGDLPYGFTDREW